MPFLNTLILAALFLIAIPFVVGVMATYGAISAYKSMNKDASRGTVENLESCTFLRRKYKRTSLIAKGKYLNITTDGTDSFAECTTEDAAARELLSKYGVSCNPLAKSSERFYVNIDNGHKIERLRYGDDIMLSFLELTERGNPTALVAHAVINKADAFKYSPKIGKHLANPKRYVSTTLAETLTDLIIIGNIVSKAFFFTGVILACFNLLYVALPVLLLGCIGIFLSGKTFMPYTTAEDLCIIGYKENPVTEEAVAPEEEESIPACVAMDPPPREVFSEGQDDDISATVKTLRTLETELNSPYIDKKAQEEKLEGLIVDNINAIFEEKANGLKLEKTEDLGVCHQCGCCITESVSFCPHCGFKHPETPIVQTPTNEPVNSPCDGLAQTVEDNISQQNKKTIRNNSNHHKQKSETNNIMAIIDA